MQLLRIFQSCIKPTQWILCVVAFLFDLCGLQNCGWNGVNAVWNVTLPLLGEMAQYIIERLLHKQAEAQWNTLSITNVLLCSNCKEIHKVAQPLIENGCMITSKSGRDKTWDEWSFCWADVMILSKGEKGKGSVQKINSESQKGLTCNRRTQQAQSKSSIQAFYFHTVAPDLTYYHTQ